MARELIAIALLAAACSKDKPAERAVPAGAAPPLASATFYRVDAGPKTPCRAGAPCEARLVLSALGSYHVNPNYPFKFVGDPAGHAIDGTGTFALDDARAGTLTVTFTPRAQGSAKLVGTFKLSVCSDDQCEIEEPRIELVVPVS